MNGTITYFGVADTIHYTGGREGFGDRWREIRLERVQVPHMLHMLLVQGLPVASVFSGEILLDGTKVSLADWKLAKCSVPPLWNVPFYLRDVVLVRGDTHKLTMEACIRVHQKKNA